MSRLPRAFYQRDTLQVAHDLLGARLVRTIDGRRVSGIVVEAEAYVGEDDLACHAARGRTARTEVMYGPPGHAYVYFIYGMYYCLNVVTESEGFPAAVLIRSLRPDEGVDVMRARRPGREDRELANGPGKLCVALNIDRRHNGLDLTTSRELFLETAESFPDASIATSPRVGIDVPGWAMDTPWRFYLAGSPFVSAPRSRGPFTVSRRTRREREA